MGIFIKDPKTDKAIRKLAELTGSSLTEAIRSAVAARAGRRASADDEDALLAELHRNGRVLP